MTPAGPEYFELSMLAFSNAGTFLLLSRASGYSGQALLARLYLKNASAAQADCSFPKNEGRETCASGCVLSCSLRWFCLKKTIPFEKLIEMWTSFFFFQIIFLLLNHLDQISFLKIFIYF